jgi:hypothetical protein
MMAGSNSKRKRSGDVDQEARWRSKEVGARVDDGRRSSKSPTSPSIVGSVVECEAVVQRKRKKMGFLVSCHASGSSH